MSFIILTDNLCVESWLSQGKGQSSASAQTLRDMPSYVSVRYCSVVTVAMAIDTVERINISNIPETDGKHRVGFDGRDDADKND